MFLNDRALNLYSILNLVKQATNLIVPPQCMLCDQLAERSGACCTKCWNKIQFVEAPYCYISGRRFDFDPSLGAEEKIICPEMIANPPPFKRARAAVVYDAFSRRLVTRLKYADRLDLAPWMARWMVRAGHELLQDDACLIPIPLHPLRRVVRRYNQSGELSRAIGKITGLQLRCDILTRMKNTRQQVGLSSSQRLRNVSGAFHVDKQNSGNIAGKRVVLIDDVFTSGATAMAACRALNRAGFKWVDVLTFARVEGDKVPEYQLLKTA